MRRFLNYKQSCLMVVSFTEKKSHGLLPLTKMIFSDGMVHSLWPSSLETLQSTSELIDYHVNALELIFGTTLSNSGVRP